MTSTSPENNITAALTGSICSRKPTMDQYDGLASSQTSTSKKSLPNSIAEAAAVRHANVFTARFLCFRRFALQLGTPARINNHFAELYCGNTHSTRPRKTTFARKSWAERHLQWEKQWHGTCKSRAGPGNTMKNISKTKCRHTASFASYCLGKVDNKGQREIKTKECERRYETE